MKPMNEQTAVITGASGAIGSAIADRLACEGMKLRLLGRNASALGAVARRAAQHSPQVLSYCGDLSTDEGLETVTQQLKQDCETVDVLIHCAGVITVAPFEQATAADFDRQYRTNVRAPYLLTQSLLPLLRAHRGSIVFVNSSAGLSVKANISQYAATKHALKAIADTLRAELNADGIRVLSIYPGRTASLMQEAVHEAEGRLYHPELLMQPEDVAKILMDALKVGPTAEVTDISVRPMQRLN